jgi:hypothetical protein
MIRLRRPKIDGKTTQEQIDQIARYLFQMVDELENTVFDKAVEGIKIENNQLMVKYTDKDGYINLGKVIGANGKTPQKGVDYFTDADKLEIVNAVLDMLSKE